MHNESQEKPDVAAIMREVETRAAGTADYDMTDRRGAGDLLHPTPDDELRGAREALDEINRFFDQLKAEFGDPAALRAGTEMQTAADQTASVHGIFHPKGSLAALRAVMLRRQTAFNNLTMDMLSRHAGAMERLFLALAQYLGAMNAALPALITGQVLLNSSTLEMNRKVESLFGHYPSLGAVADLRTAIEQLSAQVRELSPDGAFEKSAVEFEALNAQLKFTRTAQDELARKVEALTAQLEMLAEIKAPGAEPRVSGSGSKSPAPDMSETMRVDEAPLLVPNFDFLDFEGETRGGEAAIEEQQRKYLEWFRGAENVLDGGCGRGEFLELLRATGIDSYGVDSDAQMVTHCRSKGLNVSEADLVPHLRDLPAESLGGLFLGQVIEHLQPATLALVCRLAFEKLRPGAAVVMETINPTCLTTFSGAFYADPTHVKPIHPKAIEYLLQAAGFDKATMIFSAPVAADQRLAPISESAPLDPVVKELVLQMNRNFERLNSVLYSYGNYAAAVRKPGGKA